MNGFIIYDGPSVLDGQPIIAVATLKTSNAKTGNMIQTWIMRRDIEPHLAIKSGDDSSVCGGCVQRQGLGGACYVAVHQAPLSVYRSFHRGSYADKIPENKINGRDLRLGSYGDPAAVPYEVWQNLMQTVKPSVHTGYTHQIGHPKFDKRIADLCMISADTPKAASKAHGLGLRTFRVTTDASDRLPNEIECLADSDGIQCVDCGMCNGKNDSANVAITVHGSLSARYSDKFERINVINL